MRGSRFRRRLRRRHGAAAVRRTRQRVLPGGERVQRRRCRAVRKSGGPRGLRCGRHRRARSGFGRKRMLRRWTATGAGRRGPGIADAGPGRGQPMPGRRQGGPFGFRTGRCAEGRDAASPRHRIRRRRRGSVRAGQGHRRAEDVQAVRQDRGTGAGYGCTVGPRGGLAARRHQQCHRTGSDLAQLRGHRLSDRDAFLRPSDRRSIRAPRGEPWNEIVVQQAKAAYPQCYRKRMPLTNRRLQLRLPCQYCQFCTRAASFRFFIFSRAYYAYLRYKNTFRNNNFSIRIYCIWSGYNFLFFNANFRNAFVITVIYLRFMAYYLLLFVLK